MEETGGVGTPIEVLKNKLYWISDKAPPRSQSSAYFF